jgi:hypothetical protein
VWREQAPKRMLKVFGAEQGPADQKPRVKERHVDRGIKAYIDQQSATDRAICNTLLEHHTVIGRVTPPL